MQINFSNRNIVVLGGSNGIGFEVALRLAQNNANVCIVGRNLSRLEIALDRINQYSIADNKNICINSDLTLPNSAADISSAIHDKWAGKVDSLVLNAGGPPFVKNAIDVSLEDWHTYFQSLFLSQISLVAKFLDYMKNQQFGRIVSITSSSIIEPIPGLVVSSAIRSALTAWLKTLSMEIARYGITITSVPIGKVATDRLKILDEQRARNNAATMDQVVVANNTENIPIGRYGTTEEAANVILFLLSKYSSYVNGSSIYIDGGSIKKTF